MTSEAFEKEYKRLNKAQKQAVDTIEGPVMVVAGPGSGKTQVLSLRVANILQKTDTRPGNILCLTFTDSATANMRNRLASMIGQAAHKVFISTFHGFGVDIIERYPDAFYGGARFSPADALKQTEVIQEIISALPFGNPLRSEHPEQGFVYIRDVKDAITSLKRAGISPAEFKTILEHNVKLMEEANPVLAEVFEDRLSTKQFGAIDDALLKLRKLSEAQSGFPLPYFKSYGAALCDSLEKALNAAKESGKTEALSKWKSSELTKTDEGERVLKDFVLLPKLLVLADIYAEYHTKMFRLGFYDYDDMLLEVIQALEHNPSLRFDLQEQFQYVLVDEFQDTNDAQMRLLHLLLDAEVHEGRPNVCVVGDDDQAIYKFQGAELGNILGFRTMYREPALVTMTDNYRSTQIILDIARFVIERGEERLERIIPEIRKELRASNPDIAQGNIIAKSFPTQSHEYHFVAGEIKKLIKGGKRPEDIAVISRRHAELEALMPFLNATGVPVSYERKANVLREPHIKQLITMARYASSLMNKERDEADYLLPEILSYPFWGLERLEIWKLSVKASAQRMLWIDAMLASESEKVQQIAGFFIEVAELSKHEIVERVVDTLVGSHLSVAVDSDEEEMEEIGKLETGFVSPFKKFYFGAKRLEERKAEYLIFLSGLRTFINAIREHKKNELAGIEDLLSFVDIHEKNEIAIPDTSPFVAAGNSVSLLSAHKAKGLEFETVFVLNCQDDSWTGRGMGNKLPFPENLPIAPAGDTIDDQLRLFYVALTRAKSNLYLVASDTTHTGKDALRLQFLLPYGEKELGGELSNLLAFEADGVHVADPTAVLDIAATSIYRAPLVHDEDAMLRTLVENYQMSPTHFNNYLNIAKGGPQLFLEQNLIRFPQEKTLSSKFGTVMHAMIERIYMYQRQGGKIPAMSEIRKLLDFELGKERLTKRDRALLKQRGLSALEAYIDEKKNEFKPTDRIEVNFKNQGVVVGDAHLTGQIDKMVEVGKGEWSVHDFKTGRAETKWETSTPEEKMKLHRYKHQLLFYKLLVEHSREFEKQKVSSGVLEFLEPVKGKIAELPLEFDGEDVLRISKLADIVYKKITNLEFPDISGYSKDLAGIEAFEKDLLEGKI